MSDQGKKPDGWAVLQMIILAATAAAVFVSIGRRDQLVTTNSLHILELREISQDLVKSQVLSEANDANHGVRLQELKYRLERLELRSE
jgi:hypothetical protein|tara:strand:- start:4551 stop:4814 length:264 start_codon:yes stop_codon:yes gene_type:complete